MVIFDFVGSILMLRASQKRIQEFRDSFPCIKLQMHHERPKFSKRVYLRSILVLKRGGVVNH